ncbi:MAG: hypothetical protein WBN40_14080 [Pseudomonadales bacterium]
MKTAILVFCAFFVVACTTNSPVNHTQLQDGRHRLSVLADSVDAADTMLDSIKAKAAQICGGENYLLEGQDPPRRQVIPTYIDGSYVDVSNYVLSRLATCGN